MMIANSEIFVETTGGTDIHIPEGALTLGTWQQIVLLDFDNRPRSRRIKVQILGETEG